MKYGFNNTRPDVLEAQEQATPSKCPFIQQTPEALDELVTIVMCAEKIPKLEMGHSFGRGDSPYLNKTSGRPRPKKTKNIGILAACTEIAHGGLRKAAVDLWDLVDMDRLDDMGAGLKGKIERFKRMRSSYVRMAARVCKGAEFLAIKEAKLKGDDSCGFSREDFEQRILEEDLDFNPQDMLGLLVDIWNGLGRIPYVPLKEPKGASIPNQSTVKYTASKKPRKSTAGVMFSLHCAGSSLFDMMKLPGCVSDELGKGIASHGATDAINDLLEDPRIRDYFGVRIGQIQEGMGHEIHQRLQEYQGFIRSAYTGRNLDTYNRALDVLSSVEKRYRFQHGLVEHEGRVEPS